MVSAHCRDDVAKVHERRQDLGADQDVLLHVLELVRGEGALLVQDRLARPDLPDVVQPAGDAHLLDFLIRQADLVGDRSGQVRDTSGVPAHVGVLRLEGVHQRLECRHGNPLELLALAVQLGGAGGDFFFEPLVQVTILEQHLAAFQGTLHRAAQVGELDRLGEVVHRTALHAQGGAGRVVDGREHQDGELGLDLDGLGHEIDAAGSGHADVAQHEGDAVSSQLLQRLFT